MGFNECLSLLLTCTQLPYPKWDLQTGFHDELTAANLWYGGVLVTTVLIPYVSPSCPSFMCLCFVQRRSIGDNMHSSFSIAMNSHEPWNHHSERHNSFVTRMLQVLCQVITFLKLIPPWQLHLPQNGTSCLFCPWIQRTHYHWQKVVRWLLCEVVRTNSSSLMGAYYVPIMSQFDHRWGAWIVGTLFVFPVGSYLDGVFTHLSHAITWWNAGGILNFVMWVLNQLQWTSTQDRLTPARHLLASHNHMFPPPKVLNTNFWQFSTCLTMW